MKSANFSRQISSQKAAFKSSFMAWAMVLISFAFYQVNATAQVEIKENKLYEIAYSANTELVLEVDFDDNGRIKLNQRNGGNKQLFRFRKADGQHYFIESIVKEDHVLDVIGAATLAGTGLVAYPKHGNANQKFKLAANGSAYYIECASKKNFVIGATGNTADADVVMTFSDQEFYQLFQINDMGNAGNSTFHVSNEPRSHHQEPPSVSINHNGDFIADIHVYIHTMEGIEIESHWKKRRPFNHNIDVPMDAFHIEVKAEVYTDFGWDKVKPLEECCSFSVAPDEEHSIRLAGNYRTPGAIVK